MSGRHHFPYLAVGLCALVISIACAGAATAFAATVEDLQANYRAAIAVRDSALEDQEQNEVDIAAVKDEIAKTERKLNRDKERLSQAAVAMYKSGRNNVDVVDMLLGSESVTDAITRFDNYQRVEDYWSETVEDVKATRAKLNDEKAKLEENKELLAEKVKASEHAIELAEAALADADHSDGAQYHQKQGNGANCGATAFAVGVNILLHENRFADNVAVWKGPGFNGDSTQALAAKGSAWLDAYGLSDQITCEEVIGDIHSADEMRELLEQGKVVVTSSGTGSFWKRADGTGNKGLFPAGHWIVFYHYADGTFYANDSSVGASKGAGCAYDTSEMQRWLDGRGNHFSTVLTKVNLGEDVPLPDEVGAEGDGDSESGSSLDTGWQDI